MNTLILCLTYGGGMAVLVGGALRQYHDSQVKKENEALQEEQVRARDRLAEMRHRETAALIAARSELAAVREQLAAKPNAPANAKQSLASSAEKITDLDAAIEQALRDVSSDTASELRRQAEQQRWFAEGRSQTKSWDRALRPHIERILQLVTEGARGISAKGLAVMVSESQESRPKAYVYLPYDGPMAGLDESREMAIREFQFEKFKWIVRYRAGYVEMSPAREVRPHEFVSPVISILSDGQEVFSLGFGNRGLDDPSPIQILSSRLPPLVAERMEKNQSSYHQGEISGDRLVAEALAEAIKASIVRADTSK